MVRDSDKNCNYPMIEPRLYAKINFNEIRQKLIILPEDQLKIRFVTSYSNKEALGIQPEIHSPDMPSPLKERYQIPDPTSEDGFYTRLPCDDMKVADTIVCNDFFVYCTGPDDII